MAGFERLHRQCRLRRSRSRSCPCYCSASHRLRDWPWRRSGFAVRAEGAIAPRPTSTSTRFTPVGSFEGVDLVIASIAGVATLGSGNALGLEGPSIYLGARSARTCSAGSARAERRGPESPPRRGRGPRASPPSSRHRRPEPCSRSKCRIRTTLPGTRCSRPSSPVRPATSRSLPLTVRHHSSRSGVSRRCRSSTWRRPRHSASQPDSARADVRLDVAHRQRSIPGTRPCRAAHREPWRFTIAMLFFIGRAVSGESLVLTPGYDVVHWALDPGAGSRSWVRSWCCVVRDEPAAVAGGGVGGLFVPLVVAGRCWVDVRRRHRPRRFIVPGCRHRCVFGRVIGCLSPR